MLCRPCRILLIEDNPADVRLLEEAFKDSGRPADLYVATDGEQALKFLSTAKDGIITPRPDLIFLDINIPKVNGHAILQMVKSEPELQAIPVVILTSSSEPEDIRRAYGHYANAYVQKPIHVSEYFSAISEAKRYWTEVVQLP